MTSAFSSNDEAAIERIVEEKPEDPTPLELLPSLYDLDRCVSWIRSLDLHNVCLQFPNNLLPDSVSVCKYLKKHTQKQIYILGDTNYGSCCVDLIAAEHVPGDGLIHFGDACLSNSSNPRIPLLFVLKKDQSEVSRTLIATSIEEEIKSNEAILLVFSCNCSHLSVVADQWKENKKVIISRFITGEVETFASVGSIKAAISVEDTAVACVSMGREFFIPKELELSNISVIYIGKEDLFLHTLISSWTHKFKAVQCISPSGSKYHPNFQYDRLVKRQLFLAQHIKEAASVAIILANPADPSIQAASKHARKILLSRPSPPKVYTLAVGKPNPAKLANFQDIDVFVLLACPNNPLISPNLRQASCKEFYKPIVGLGEVEMAINQARTNSSPDYKEIIEGGFDYVPLQEVDTSQEADISLLTGRVIKMTTDFTVIADGSIVAKEDNLKVANLSIGGLLANRTWQGLEPSLGKDDPSLVTEGRSGIAFSYQSEPK